MRKPLFFLCALLSAALIAGNVSGEELSPDRKAGGGIRAVISATDDHIMIDVRTFGKSILNFKKGRFKKYKQELPVLAQGKKVSDSPDSYSFRTPKGYIDEKVRELPISDIIKIKDREKSAEKKKR